MKHHAWPRTSLGKLQLMMSGHFPTQTWLQSVRYAKTSICSGGFFISLVNGRRGGRFLMI